MVVGLDERATADRLFHALSDATRRDIVTTVLGEEHSVSSLARRYPMSFAAVQKHVAMLEEVGLVSKRKHGREQLVRGEVDEIRRAQAALDQMEQVWRDRVARMDEILAEDP
jgi:DNA-binding transcriptional ArsR family regulator